METGLLLYKGHIGYLYDGLLWLYACLKYLTFDRL